MCVNGMPNNKELIEMVICITLTTNSILAVVVSTIYHLLIIQWN